MVMPCRDLAGGIQATLKPVPPHGAVEVMPHVVLTGPDQLDRAAEFLGDRDALGDVIVVQAAAEPATDAGEAHLDLVLRQTGDLRGHLLGAARVLGWGKDLKAAILGGPGSAVLRLQVGVRNVGIEIGGLDFGGGCGQGGCDIPVLSHHLAGTGQLGSGLGRVGF